MPLPPHSPDPARAPYPAHHHGQPPAPLPQAPHDQDFHGNIAPHLPPHHPDHQFAAPEMQHQSNSAMAMEEVALGSALDPGFDQQNEQVIPQHQSAPDLLPPMEVKLPPDWPVEKEQFENGQHVPVPPPSNNMAVQHPPSPTLSPTKQPQPVAEGWLSVQSVFKSYKKRPVVRDVSLNVRRGESVGLLGPNGAGKTTVFYMITGLVPADQGGIIIDGFDVTKLPMYRRSRLGIGYLPQEASIFRGLTVEDNIMAVLQVVEKSAKKRRQKLDSLLEEFNIERLRKSPSIALSGGERRRCEIARALASDPSYMLLDEPFAGIDPIAIGDIRELVRHLTERGIGVLITDHNVRETLSMIDRAYIIHDGNVLMEGAPDEIIANEDVRRVYLGDMFT